MSSRYITEHKTNYEGVTGLLEVFPGFCHSLGISYNVVVPLDKRNQGLGTKAHEERLREAKRLGYRYLLCSVRNDNKAQHKIMSKFGWARLAEFNTSCHSVTLFGKSLYPEEIVNFPA